MTEYLLLRLNLVCSSAILPPTLQVTVIARRGDKSDSTSPSSSSQSCRLKPPHHIPQLLKVVPSYISISDGTSSRANMVAKLQNGWKGQQSYSKRMTYLALTSQTFGYTSYTLTPERLCKRRTPILAYSGREQVWKPCSGFMKIIWRSHSSNSRLRLDKTRVPTMLALTLCHDRKSQTHTTELSCITCIVYGRSVRCTLIDY